MSDIGSLTLCFIPLTPALNVGDLRVLLVKRSKMNRRISNIEYRTAEVKGKGVLQKQRPRANPQELASLRFLLNKDFILAVHFCGSLLTQGECQENALFFQTEISTKTSFILTNLCL